MSKFKTNRFCFHVTSREFLLKISVISPITVFQRCNLSRANNTEGIIRKANYLDTLSLCSLHSCVIPVPQSSKFEVSGGGDGSGTFRTLSAPSQPLAKFCVSQFCTSVGRNIGTLFIQYFADLYS